MPVDIGSIRCAISSTFCSREEVEDALTELEQLRAKARALIEALPKCEEPECPDVATMFVETSHYRYDYCATHTEKYKGDRWFDLPWAQPLRDLLALLGEG